MENLYATLLAFLEMTFIFVGLGLLHSQRKIIGSAAFYVAIGMLFLFAQLISASELKVHTAFLDMDFYVGSTVLFMPYLAALLLVYVTEGTLAAQRLIIGAVTAFGLFFYLSSLTRLQCNWMGFSISQGTSADTLDYLLEQSKRSMTGSTLAQILDLFLLPIFFQRLRNAKCRLFFCVLGALVFTQIADSFVFLTVIYWDRPQWWVYINTSFVIKSIAALWLSALITVYLQKIEKEVESPERSYLDIIFAFFGGYGKAKALERDLREWEGRYRMVVENASEMIMLLDYSGKVIDANLAAAAILGAKSSNDLFGMKFLEILKDEKGNPVKAMAFKENPFGEFGRKADTVRFKAFTSTDIITRKHLDIALSAIEFEEVYMLILLARDITEESRLAREKEKLSEQLAHSQRLEAVGQLAGGIAHDFNNHIHAILGHLDVIRMIYTVDNPNINKHLDKIAAISEQAGHLTGQLLGFARKGKYQEVEFDLGELVKKSTELFMPNSQRDLELVVGMEEEKMLVRGDKIQLQQVMINLMINAKDAMENNGELGKHLEVYAGRAINCQIKLRPLGVDEGMVHPENYYFIMVKDNGDGMDLSTKQRIFEPFFTTKPIGKGTGMGLAMVYGTISNHHGWVQVKSSPGNGAAFYLFIPKINHQ
ncbi:MAG: ATP-binding protein [Victivallaceae bacterium]